MKIVTLIENLVYQKGLIAEHGISLYIDTGNKKILFDTGQSPAFIANAEQLGIDIAGIDAVIISHGHYDHTGGLEAFMKKNSHASVYLKKEALADKYKDKSRFIGITCNKELLKERSIYVNSITEIDKNLFIMPDIPVYNPADTSFNNFFVSGKDGLLQDEFKDELFLAIVKDEKLSVLSSCSHRGISNIAMTAKKQFGLPLHLIMGGFHLKNSGDKQCQSVKNFLAGNTPGNIGVCHCTGIEKFAEMKQCIGECNVFYNFAGNTVVI